MNTKLEYSSAQKPHQKPVKKSPSKNACVCDMICLSNCSTDYNPKTRITDYYNPKICIHQLTLCPCLRKTTSWTIFRRLWRWQVRNQQLRSSVDPMDTSTILTFWGFMSKDPWQDITSAKSLRNWHVFFLRKSTWALLHRPPLTHLHAPRGPAV